MIESRKSQIISRITELKLENWKALTEANRLCQVATDCAWEICRLEDELSKLDSSCASKP